METENNHTNSRIMYEDRQVEQILPIQSPFEKEIVSLKLRRQTILDEKEISTFPSPSHSTQLKEVKYRVSKRRARILKQMEECQVCFSQCNKSQLLPFAKCKHSFCPGCLNHQIQGSIKNFQRIKCLEEGCPSILQIRSPHIISLPIPQQEKYYRILAFSNLSNDADMKLCPTQGCEGFIVISASPIQCAICNKQFCKKCLLRFHEGDCDQNGKKVFLKQFGFQKCNNCRMILQKNDGCNHMTCKCGYQFCYICGGVWGNNHQCNSASLPIAIVPDPIRTIQVNQNNANQNQQRPPSRMTIGDCICIFFKCILLAPIILLVLVVSCQLLWTVIVSFPILVILVLSVFTSIVLGIITMKDRYSWKLIVLANIFLLLYCIGQQYCQSCRWMYGRVFGNREIYFFFPMSSNVYRLLSVKINRCLSIQE